MTHDEKQGELAKLNTEIELAQERTNASIHLYKRNLAAQARLEERRLQLIGIVPEPAPDFAAEHGQGPGAVPAEEHEGERVITAPLGPVDPKACK